MNPFDKLRAGAQPNTWPTLEPGSHRWCEAPNSAPRIEQCSWSTQHTQLPAIAPCCRGILGGAGHHPRWCVSLSVLCGSPCPRAPEAVNLTGTAGGKSALNSAAAWRLNLQPQPNRRTS